MAGLRYSSAETEPVAAFSSEFQAAVIEFKPEELSPEDALPDVAGDCGLPQKEQNREFNEFPCPQFVQADASGRRNTK
jgi:hypothetical protein